MSIHTPAARPTPARARTNRLISAAVSAAIGTTLLATAVQAADEELGEVTITGSRIQRPRDLSAPSPIVTVATRTFENTSATGAEAVLNKMPQFVPGTTQFTSSIQGAATVSPSTATLNLRGLGSNRNLVLLDGRRAQPANASLVIDVNTIPWPRSRTSRSSPAARLRSTVRTPWPASSTSC